MMVQLTARGWWFLTAGVVFTVVAGIAALPALQYGAGLLLALTLSSLVLVGSRRSRLSIARSVEPTVLEPKENCAVILCAVDRSRKFSTRWRDKIGSALVGDPTGMWRSDRRCVSYQVSSHVRGDHVVGPLTIVTTDPFGLVRRRTVTDGDARVTVLPARTPLASTELGTSIATTSSQLGARQVAADADDVVARAYVPGDAVKRINWKSTARVGELMVRQPEQHEHHEAAVLLDLQLDRHTTEWAISAAASVLTHLSAGGYDVALRSSDGSIDLRVGEGHLGITDAMLALARCQANDSPAAGLNEDALVVLVAGNVSPERASEWLYACRQATAVVALVASTTPDPVVESLRATGWAVSQYDSSSDLGQLWSNLDSGRRRVA